MASYLTETETDDENENEDENIDENEYSLFVNSLIDLHE